MVLKPSDKKRIEEEEQYRAEVRENLKKEKEVKPKKKGKGCLTILVIFIILFILILILGSNSNNKNTNTTNTKVDNSEVKSTETSSNQTSTDVDNEAIIAYSTKMAAIAKNISDAMTNISTLAGKWPNWTNNDVINFASYGLIIQGGYKDASELKPPIILESAHNTALKGFKLWSDSVPLINSGIDNYDVDKIKQATQMIQEGTNYIKDATDQITEISNNLLN